MVVSPTYITNRGIYCTVTSFGLHIVRCDLNETNAVRHVKSILVRSQTDERLLLAVGTDERVHLGSVDVVDLLQRLLNLALVGLAVNNEDKSVHLLNLLHGALSVQREQENLVSVSARRMRGTLARVFRVARKTESLRAVERGRGVHLAHTLLTRATLLHDLLGHVRLPRRQVLLFCVSVSIVVRK